MLKSSQSALGFPAIKLHDGHLSDGAIAAPHLRLAAVARPQAPASIGPPWKTSSHVLWFGPDIALRPVGTVTDKQ